MPPWVEHGVLGRVRKRIPVQVMRKRQQNTKQVKEMMMHVCIRKFSMSLLNYLTPFSCIYMCVCIYRYACVYVCVCVHR